MLLEKPISLNFTKALAIRRAAGLSESRLMVAHVVRFSPGYSLLEAAVAGGAFGRVLSARAQRISCETGSPLSLHDESRLGGMLIDFGIHDFDQINLFLGDPIAVSSFGGGSQPVETSIEFWDGGTGQVLNFMSMPAGFSFTISLELFGGNGLAGYYFTAPLSGDEENSSSGSYRAVTGNLHD